MISLITLRTKHHPVRKSFQTKLMTLIRRHEKLADEKPVAAHGKRVNIEVVYNVFA